MQCVKHTMKRIEQLAKVARDDDDGIALLFETLQRSLSLSLSLPSLSELLPLQSSSFSFLLNLTFSTARLK